MSDIKMSDVFHLPMECASSKDDTGVRCTELADYDFILADFWYAGCEWPIEKAHEMAEAAAHAINAHDDLVKQNEELSTRIERLEFSLDDLRCYIADADMKNEELKKQNEKLNKALFDIERSITDIQDGFDISKSDADILEIVHNALLKESE